MENGSDSKLQAVFATVGKEAGYDFVEARFYPFKEMKSTWCRNRWKVTFRISDYLEKGDEPVLREYARALFQRIGGGNGMVYEDRVLDWLKSPEFLARNQPLYLGRSRNLSLTPLGEEYDLRHSLDLLEDRGLVNHHEPYLTWTRVDNRRRVGYCSVLMKVIAISSALDSPRVPELVHRYVLYHELLHLEMGRESLSPRHGREFRRREREFPGWEEAESWLRGLALGERPGQGLER